MPIAIRNGKFVYVGDAVGAKAFISEGTKEEHYLRFNLESLTATAKKSVEQNFTIHIHTIGDGAIAFAWRRS